MDGRSLKYEPALDGLRAVAILLVVAFHAGVPGFSGGRVGVDLFFVLSGYLITSILLSGRPLMAFFVGRLRRLVPAFLVMTAVVLAIAPAIMPPNPYIHRDAAFAALYLTDLWAPLVNEKGPFLHTWSLALEMQFYLAWPFLLRLPKAALMPALVIAWIALTAARFVILSGAGLMDPLDLTPLRASGLILGGLLALRPPAPQRWMGAAGLALLMLAMILAKAITASAIALTLTEIAAALLILGLRVSDAALTVILSRPEAVRLGMLSYGLYLWHYPIAIGLRPHVGWLGVLSGELVLGLAAAAFSLWWIEKPFHQPLRVARMSPG